MFVTHIV